MRIGDVTKFYIDTPGEAELPVILRRVSEPAPTLNYFTPGGQRGSPQVHTNQRLLLGRFYAARQVTVDRWAIRYTVNGSSSATAFKALVYNDDGTGTWPGSLLRDLGTVSGMDTGAPAVKESADLLPALTWGPGIYWVGGFMNGSGTMPTLEVTNAITPLPTNSAATVLSQTVGSYFRDTVTSPPDPYGTVLNVTNWFPRIAFRLT